MRMIFYLQTFTFLLILFQSTDFSFPQASPVLDQTKTSPKNTGFLDDLKISQNAVTAHGWAGAEESTNPVIQISIFADTDKIYSGSFKKTQRPDVAKATGRSDWLESGWVIRAPLPRPLPAGKRIITAVASQKNGDFFNLNIPENNVLIVDTTASNSRNPIDNRVPLIDKKYITTKNVTLAIIILIGSYTCMFLYKMGIQKKLLKNPFFLKTLFILLGFFSAKIVAYVSFKYSKENNYLEITGKISDGSRLEIFINGDWYNPISKNIIKNKLTTYKFENIPNKISLIRLDPTDLASGDVDLNEINVIDPIKKIKKTIFLNEKTITLNKITLYPLSKGGYKLKITGDDPWIMLPLNIELTSNLFAEIKEYIKENIVFGYFAVWPLALVIIIQFKDRKIILDFVICAVLLYFGIKSTLVFAISSTNVLPNTMYAVGLASFSGYSFESQKRGFLWILLCICVFCPFYAYTRKKLLSK